MRWMWKCGQANVGAEPPNIAKEVDAAQAGTAGRPPGRKPHYRRRSGRPPASAPDGSTRRKGRPRGPSQRSVLLDLDPGAGFLELSLDLVGLLLRDAFLDGVRSSVDEALGLLQAQPRDRADDLDHLDLLVAGTGEHHVEGSLLLLRAGAVATGRSPGRGHRNGSGGGHAPLLLELVLQPDEVEHVHAAELLDELVGISLRRHLLPPLLTRPKPARPLPTALRTALRLLRLIPPPAPRPAARALVPVLLRAPVPAVTPAAALCVRPARRRGSVAARRTGRPRSTAAPPRLQPA